MFTKLAVLCLSLVSGVSLAQMMGGAIATTQYFPLVDGARYEYMYTSGYNIEVHHGVMVVTMYSYGAGGDPQWYLVVGNLANAGGGVVATGTLDKYRGGQCASCMYQNPTVMGNDGGMTITFASPTTATVQLPGGRATQIQPYAF